MSFGLQYSTIVKLILVGLSLFPVIIFTRELGVIDLSGPAGEFTSPEYPDTPTGLVCWNITVNKDHRILLQFLDFQFVETPLCHLDLFELYDGAFEGNTPIGKWCWDTFEELNHKTFTSSGNVLFLRLRTHPGYSRRGLKANYISISNEATTNNTVTVYTAQTSTTDELTNLLTTSSQHDATATDVVSTIPASLEAEMPSSSVSSSQTAMSSTNASTETTDRTNSSVFPRAEQFYFVGAGGGILIILLCCLVACSCCLCGREKRNTQDSKESNDTEFQVLAPAATVQSSENPVKENSYPVKPSIFSHEDVTEKDKNSALSQDMRGASPSPTYAMPFGTRRQVAENGKNSSKQNKGKESEDKSKELLIPSYATAHGMEKESTEFEMNVAYQSCEFEKENSWNTDQINNEYTYVENTDVSTDRPKAAPRVKDDDATYSLPEGEEVENEELVPNIAYQSFDMDDEHVEDRESVDMTTNVAYQSCESEEERVGKNDATYYYLDENNSDKREAQKDVVYESV